MRPGLVIIFILFVASLVLSGCGEKEGPKHTLYIAGIPDQNASQLARRYEELTSYLSQQLGVDVEYVPTVDYAATVTAFRQDAVQLAWFGGLTGVMARMLVPGSEALAQRPRDEEFHSVFIVHAGLDVSGLEDLKRATSERLTFTFGSELSTSGHLMPRHSLLQSGIDPEADFRGQPSYSGSHDKTWKLVESGAFQVGVLNEAVWEAAVESGKVDVRKVRVFHTTPPYHDYNWTVRGDVDQRYGDGFKERLRDVLTTVGSERSDLLGLFSTDRFIASENSNYQPIRDVAEAVGIVK